MGEHYMTLISSLSVSQKIIVYNNHAQALEW